MISSEKTKIVNTLTQLIKTNKATVSQVLSNYELCSSVEKEVPELLDFFSPIQPSPPNAERPANLIGKYKLQEDRQNELSLLAFSPKKKFELKYIYNINAANIISNPSKQFHDRLVYYYSDGNGKYTPSPFLDQLIKFARSIKDGLSSDNLKLSCGNFSRIFESIVKTSKGQLFDIIYKIAPDLNPFYSIILKTIYLTSIRQLFVTCLSEYPQKFINQNLSKFFIELTKFGVHHSNHIRSKKEKELKEIKEIYADILELSDYDRHYVDSINCEPQYKLDEVGLPIKLIYTTKYKLLESNKNVKDKKSRYGHFQLVVASVFIIRDILDHSPDMVNYMRNNDVIENLLRIGKNSPDSTSVVKNSYNLILRIITSNNRSLNDFSDVLNQKEFLPDIYVLPDLKKRIETLECDCDFLNLFAGEHLIYQLPLYFFKLPTDVHNLFFSDKKYSLIFDKQFVFTIKNVLSKKEQIEYFTKDDNFFLKKLCKVLPDPPKLDSELPDVPDKEVFDELRPKQHEPLQSFLWDIAYYIDDYKRFNIDEIPFKKEKKWRILHNKVKEYYGLVYSYVENPDGNDGEENEDEEIDDKNEDKEIEQIKIENEELKAKINEAELDLQSKINENESLKEKADQLKAQINEKESNLLSKEKENELL